MRRLPVMVLLVLWSSTALAAQTYDNLDRAVDDLTDLLVLRAQANGVNLEEESVYVTPCDFRERGRGPFSGLSKRLAGLFSQALGRHGVSVVAERGEGEEMLLRAEWTVEEGKLLLEPQVLRAIRTEPDVVATHSGRVSLENIDRSHFKKDPALSCDSEPEPVNDIETDPDEDAAKREEDALDLDSAARKDVQRGLSSLGLEVGPIDGLFGGRTREALRAWQLERRVDGTGYLTKQQAVALIALGREVEEEARRERLERAEEEARREREEEARRERLERAVSEALAGAEDALNREEVRKAKGHVEELRRLAGDHARLGELEARIEELEKRYLPRKRFRDCPACPEMVVVPPGEFMMGSPESEAMRWNSEGPVHGVRIGYPFAVGVYEATRGEYSRFVSATGHSHSSGECFAHKSGERRVRDWRSPGFQEETDAHPVVCVTWEDAKAYVGWLSKETGEEYRLLSESEWEYVARAGTSSPFHTGETISTGQANYLGYYDYPSGHSYLDRLYRGGSVAVGSFDANGYGLHDVHGNVWEWVEDCVNSDYRGAPADGSAWETGHCGARVYRGGSWDEEPWYLRSAFRGQHGSGGRLDDVGFRVARTLTP